MTLKTYTHLTRIGVKLQKTTAYLSDLMLEQDGDEPISENEGEVLEQQIMLLRMNVSALIDMAKDIMNAESWD